MGDSVQLRFGVTLRLGFVLYAETVTCVQPASILEN